MSFLAYGEATYCILEIEVHAHKTGLGIYWNLGMQKSEKNL